MYVNNIYYSFILFGLITELGYAFALSHSFCSVLYTCECKNRIYCCDLGTKKFVLNTGSGKYLNIHVTNNVCHGVKSEKVVYLLHFIFVSNGYIYCFKDTSLDLFQTLGHG